jgi:hypothetical protein
VKRLAVLAAGAGLAAAQYGVALAYSSRGTWWHYLLHQLVGWGVGLALAALVAAWTRYRIRAVPALLLGQLFSIVPDLQFRYQRMPHMASMDVYLGHISIHRGPFPTLVALACVLLGGWAFLATGSGRRRAGTALGAVTLVLLAAACLIAEPIPSRIVDFPPASSPVRG